MIVFAGTSNPELAQRIAQLLHATLGTVKRVVFANGEIKPVLVDAVTDKDVCIVQSLSTPTHEALMELLLLSNAAKHAGAKRIILVVPWMAYSLQNEVFVSGEPLSAQVIAQMLSASECTHVVLVHLHSEKLKSFFSVPVTEVSTEDLFVEEAKRDGIEVIVAPDKGGLVDAKKFAQKVGLPLALVDKSRNRETGEISVLSVSGDIQDKVCLILDDIINTGGTAAKDAHMLKEHGAKRIVFYATHGLFAGKARELLEKSDIDKMVITDTVKYTHSPMHKLTILSIAQSIADVVQTVTKRA